MLAFAGGLEVAFSGSASMCILRIHVVLVQTAIFVLHKYCSSPHLTPICHHHMFTTHTTHYDVATCDIMCFCARHCRYVAPLSP